MKDNIRLKFLLAIVGLFTADTALAAEKVIDPNELSNYLEQWFLIGGACVICAALIAILNVYNAIMESAKIQALKDAGLPVPETPDYVRGPSWWSKQYDRWTNAVPVAQEHDVMLDHDYDGIRELDNSLPPWWIAMFYISIVVAVVYFGYYHVMDYGHLSGEAYEKEMAAAEQQIKRYLASQANTVDETNVTMLEDIDAIAIGQTTYNANCAACHGTMGEGGVGPNLTDPYWLHGGDIKDVFKTIKYGVPEKGMIAWKSQLRPVEIHQIASYIMTLHGTAPPNAKDPQGELYQAINNTEE